MFQTGVQEIQDFIGSNPSILWSHWNTSHHLNEGFCSKYGFTWHQSMGLNLWNHIKPPTKWIQMVYLGLCDTAGQVRFKLVLHRANSCCLAVQPMHTGPQNSSSCSPHKTWEFTGEFGASLRGLSAVNLSFDQQKLVRPRKRWDSDTKSFLVLPHFKLWILDVAS